MIALEILKTFYWFFSWYIIVYIAVVVYFIYNKCITNIFYVKVHDMKKIEMGTNNLIISTKEDEVEKEKEEMRRASERINRKFKSIIRYIDNTDTLKIEIDSKTNKTLKPSENLTNWEDMFDDSGELKEVYLEEVNAILLLLYR